MNKEIQWETRKYPLLAWYRLRKLESRELVHFIVALGALLLGVFIHFLRIEGWYLLFPLSIVVLVESFLLYEEFVNLSVPTGKNITIKSCYDDIHKEINMATLPKKYRYETFNFNAGKADEERPIEGVLRSDDLDNWLFNSNPCIKLIIRTGGYEKDILQDNECFLREAFDYLILRQRLKNSSLSSNESKISLRTELIPELTKVTVGLTSYITSCLTNDACTIKLERINQAGTYADLTGMYPIADNFGNKKVLDLGSSKLSNHLGASTVALIQQEDGNCFIILPVQNSKASRSENLFAPTGSGSLDWTDIEYSRKNDLLSVVVFGAQRELCEEHSLIKMNANAIELKKIFDEISIRTVVLGYFRWMTLGGLPQFSCFTTAKVKSIYDLKPNSKELKQKDAVGLQKDTIWPISSLAEVKDLCDEMLDHRRIDISIPLLINLDLVRKLLGGDFGDDAYRKFSSFINCEFKSIL